MSARQATDDDAHASAQQDHRHGDTDRGRERQDEQAVHRILAAEQGNRSGQHWGSRNLQRVVSPDPTHRFAQHEKQSEDEQQLVGMAVGVDAPQQTALHRSAEQPHYKRGDQQ